MKISITEGLGIVEYENSEESSKLQPKVEEFLWISTGASFGGTADFTSRAVGSSTEAKVDYIRVWRMN